MEKNCSNCIFRVWAVGIGQGVFCLCEENDGKNLGFGMNTSGKPLLPHEKGVFVCEHHIKESDG